MNADQGKAFLNFFLGTIEQEAPTTGKVIAAVPNDRKSYKPDEKSKTAHELAWHIASSEIFFLDAMLAGKFDMSGDEAAPAPATIAEIVNWYEKNHAQRLAQVKALPIEKLLQPLPFFGVMEMPALMYLSVMTHHTAHHRGQLSAYLRSMGGKIPSIYGGSADEPFQMPAQAS